MLLSSNEKLLIPYKKSEFINTFQLSKFALQNRIINQDDME
jgi:hypothetical protein